MKKAKLLLVGANGRMGKEIRKALKKSNFFSNSVALASERVPGFSRTVSSLSELRPGEVDLVLDFSLPEMALESLSFATRKKIPWVSGVTGFSPGQKQKIRKAGSQTKIFWAPNMSLGVVAVGAALKSFGILQNVQIEIIETHHTKKKDKPSGTAIFLKGKLEGSGLQVKKIRALRKGHFVGKHEIKISSPEEEIYIQHNALKRAVFAKGAVFASEWILSQKKKGFYTFDDILEAF